MEHYPMDLKGVDGPMVPRDIVVPYLDREEAERLNKALDRAAGSDVFHLDQFRIVLSSARDCTKRRLEADQDKGKE
jgi:hypothetical protein